MAAPIGNKNAVKENRLWSNALKRAVTQSNSERLMRIAEVMLMKAEDGDMTAIKELGDRLDGKAVSTTELSGPNGGDIPVGILVIYE